MGVCSQMLVLLIVVFACARARPSDPSRESRAANEFKFSPHPENYDDKLGNAEHKIPVHLVYSDENPGKSIVQFGEQNNAEPSVSVKIAQEAIVPNIEKYNETPSHSSSTETQSTSTTETSDATIQHATIPNNPITKNMAVASEDDSDNRQSKAINNYDKSKFTIIKSDNEQPNKIKQFFEQNNHETFSTAGQNSGEMETFPYNGQNMSKNKRIVQAMTTDPQISNNPFENPILTYLSQQQAAGKDNLDSLQNKNQMGKQNIRREIFHQQTIVNPNPYMQQLLHQQSQPYPEKAQMHHSPSSNIQYLSYPPSGNFPNSVATYQPAAQTFVKSPELNRNDIQANPENYVTTLTLYPAIASVMYTMPASGITNTPGSIPPPSTIYPSQTNPQYFGHPSFSDPNNPTNLANTRIFTNNAPVASRLSWPLSGYFPIVIKDPFISMYNAMTNMVEYGPEADVCKKAKSFRQGRSRVLLPEEFGFTVKTDGEIEGKVVSMENGGWRDIGKEETEYPSARKMPAQEEDTEEARNEEGKKKKGENQDTEVVMESGGNGNAGPYITRLLVRKGGVSIAGPGGIATAGSGGTAIVGPGGVAYTSPNGLAVVGPGGKVVGLPSGADLSVIASQISASSTNKEGSTPRLINIPPGGRVVATGPIVYYHKPEE